MESAIIGTTKINASDYVKFNMVLLLNNRVYQLILFLASPLFIIWGIYLLTKGQITNAFIYFALVLFYIYIFVFYRMQKIKSTFRKSEKLKQPIKYVITENEIRISNDDIDEKWVWREFKKYKIFENYAFIYFRSNPNSAKVIMKNAFSNNEEYEKIVSIIKEKVLRKV